MRTAFLVLFLILFFLSPSYCLEVYPGVVFDHWSMVINRNGIRLEHYELRDIYTVTMNDGSSAIVIDLGCDGTFDIVMVDGRSVFRESSEYKTIRENVVLWMQKVNYQKNVEEWNRWKEKIRGGE